MAVRVKIIQERCSCRRRLGREQAGLELRIKNGETPVKAIENLGFHLGCCRLAMLYPTTYPVCDSNSGVFYDEIGINEGPTRGRLTVTDGCTLYLENVPDFPTFPGSKKK
jgi:DNA-directed RNA polymerase subunit N (RpoN/RPB10)